MSRLSVAAACLLSCTASHALAQDAGVVRTLWTAAEDGATITPDGRRVAFIDWSSSDVAVRDIATGAVVRLTDEGAFAESVGFPEPHLVFSPDGDRIVFPFGNSLDGAPFRYELRLVGVGDPVRQVLAVYPSDIEFLAPLDWDAGLGILFTTVAADGSSELLVMRPDERTVRVVEQRPAGSGVVHRALFTPDRSAAVYLANGRLWQVSLSGGTARELGIEAEALLGWSSDGTALLFHAARGDVVGNWAVVVSGGRAVGEPELRQATAAGVVAAGQSSAGVAYLEPAALPGLFSVMLDVESGDVVRGPESIPVPAGGVPGNPAWSRDGARLAFTLRAPNRTLHRVMVSEGVGGPVREIARVDLRVMGLAWSADGRFLVVGGRADTRQLGWIGRIGVGTGAIERRATAPVNALAAGVGEEVAYVRAAPAGERTVRVTVLPHPGAAPRVIATYVAAELPRTMSVSPDGKWLALVRAVDGGRASALLLLPVAGGEGRVLLRLERPDALELNVGGLPWTAAGDRVLVALRFRGRRQLAAVRVDSGAATMVSFAPQRGGRWQPALRAGGGEMVYVDGAETNDLKLMVHARGAGQRSGLNE